jgi:hypothetical protein
MPSERELLAMAEPVAALPEPRRWIPVPLARLRARGGIPLVATDGFRYEIRNRMTLCWCGASRNKPFCDGTHAAIGFRDGIEPPP